MKKSFITSGPGLVYSGPEVINIFSSSTQLSMKFKLLISYEIVLIN